jgi:hypothetical protein
MRATKNSSQLNPASLAVIDPFGLGSVSAQRGFGASRQRPTFIAPHAPAALSLEPLTWREKFAENRRVVRRVSGELSAPLTGLRGYLLNHQLGGNGLLKTNGSFGKLVESVPLLNESGDHLFDFPPSEPLGTKSTDCEGNRRTKNRRGSQGLSCLAIQRVSEPGPEGTPKGAVIP